MRHFNTTGKSVRRRFYNLQAKYFCAPGWTPNFLEAAVICPTGKSWPLERPKYPLPGDEAIMHRDGDRLVIEPLRKRGLVALLRSMTSIKESFPEIDDPEPPPERVL